MTDWQTEYMKLRNVIDEMRISLENEIEIQDQEGYIDARARDRLMMIKLIEKKLTGGESEVKTMQMQSL